MDVNLFLGNNFGIIIAPIRNAYFLKIDYTNGRKTANDDSSN